MTQAAAVQFGHDRRALDPQRGFENFHEYLASVMQAGHGSLDERLVPLFYAAAGSDEQAGYSDPAGGFLLPEVWAPRALTRTVDDPSAGRTMQVVMTAPVVHVAARVDADHSTSVSGGVRMMRHLETADVDPTRIGAASIEATANELLGVSYASERLVTDSPRTFLDLLERSYHDETTSVLLEERVRGTGVGECLGVLNSGCLITIAKESGQAAASVVGDNFLKMRARTWGYGRAVWIVTPDLYPQILKATIAVGTGGSTLPIWQPGTDADGIPDRILGRPAFFHESASSAGSLGDLILVNWGEYVDFTYVPLVGQSSIHVRYTALERAFRFYTRGDGQPWWRTAMQPKRSQQTVSPFVTLAVRS